MTNGSKYLIFRESLEVSRLIPILFSEPVVHLDMANFIQRVYPKSVLLSGGRCVLDLDRREFECYNGADGMPSLRVAKGDIDILIRAFCQYDDDVPGSNF